MADRYKGVVYINGEFKPAEEAAVSVFDHGFLYGDGVFDTAFAKYGYLFKLQEHLARFRRSLRAVCLDISLDQKALEEAVVETVVRNGLTDAYVKIVATRGRSAEPVLDPRGCTPTLIIFARPYLWLVDPKKQQSGLNVRLATVRRVPLESVDPRIKSLNYMNLILAKLEAVNNGCDEALLMDMDGMVCEAPGFNVFVVANNVVMTPDVSILEGITRETVLALCHELQVPCSVRPVAPYDLYTANEVFLTSTAAGLMPVTRIDGRIIGDGALGPVFQKLSGAYEELLRAGRFGTRIPLPAVTGQ